MRVLNVERIEGPLDQIDTARQGIVPLAKLELAANARIAILRQHTQHVAVQIDLPSLLQTGNRDTESDHAIAIECAQQLATDFRRHHKHPERKQVGVFESPDRFLQGDGFAKLRLGGKLPNQRLASCQSASNSSIGVPFTSLPCAARRRSTCPKRSRNLVLVRRSACSGSTFTKRARLTSTNSRSPSSSSI